MGKQQLFEAWAEVLRERLAQLERGRDAARSGTRVDGSHRPANRGERAAVTSQGYLTAGLAERVATLKAQLQLLEAMPPSPRYRVALGAEVTLEDEAGTLHHFAVLPGGQGDAIPHAGRTVLVVAPDAPVIAPAVGLGVDDEIQTRLSGRRQDAVIVDVQ